jgi:hypothetical protein
MKLSLVSKIMLGSVFAVAIALPGCGKKEPTPDLGESLGNALVLGMAKDQYAKAKANYDKGEDATLDCIMDTNELRKDKSAEAQKVANDLDVLCEVDVPSRQRQKDLDDKLKDVQASRKSNDGMLEANQLLLKYSCEDTDKALKTMTEKNLSTSPNAKSLSDKKTATCTKENLEGKAKKTARR